ncbi:hypothetical protein DIPPA_02714 [Diplonema papillatum]|nr:hypothetical protein DIPPA_02714 [Diplonema papillatum]
MALGVRALVTCMCVLAVVLAIAALWVSAAIMAVDSLTKAREDQLASAAVQIGVELFGFFGQASTAAASVARMYNLSAMINPDAPEVQMYEDYGSPIYLMFREAPSLYSATAFALRDPNVLANAAPEDQTCDMDGYFFGNQIGALFNANSTGNPPGCDPTSVLNACSPGSMQVNINAGEGFGRPGQMIANWLKFPCFVLGYSGPLWETIPGNFSERDTGIRTPQWASEILSVDPGQGLPHYLLRSLRFPLVGPDHAPNGAFGFISLQLNRNTAAFQVTDTPQDVLVAAAAVSDYDDLLILFTARRELLATSDPTLSVDRYGDDGLLALHQADNETAIGSRIAGIASDTFGRYCTPIECDWSQVARLRNIDDDIVAFAELEDPSAGNLAMLLVIAVSKSEILEPAQELNTNIAIISCSILVVMTVVSFIIASKLATPIAAFADRLLAASMMADLDDASYSKSHVAELALMEDALQVLVAQLLEYKSFLPASMFENDQTDEEEGSSANQSQAKPSDGSQKHSSHGARSRAGESVASKIRANPIQVAKMTTCALFLKTVTMLCTNVRGWSRSVMAGAHGAQVVAEQGKYISQIAAGLSNKGKIDRFNGDRVMISFGSSSACSASTACKIGLQVLQLLVREAPFVENGVVGGMARGLLLVGNSGEKNTRAFNLMGPAVNISWKLADIATQFCEVNACELLFYGPLFSDVEIEFEALPVGQLSVGKKFPWSKTLLAPVHLVTRLKQAENEDEWMYQVAELEGNSSADTTAVALLTPIFSGELDESIFLKNQAALHSAFKTSSKPALAGLLATSYVDFSNKCMHKL